MRSKENNNQFEYERYFSSVLPDRNLHLRTALRRNHHPKINPIKKLTSMKHPKSRTINILCDN
jgi:hypothetical protein